MMIEWITLGLSGLGVLAGGVAAARAGAARTQAEIATRMVVECDGHVTGACAGIETVRDRIDAAIAGMPKSRARKAKPPVVAP